MPSNRPPLTQARLKELLRYDPETGHFTWRVARANIKPGTTAGSPSTGGYIKIRLDNRLNYAHRLAFVYMLGRLPDFEVDHIDCDPSNNAWDNLRGATSSENGANRPKSAANTSGFKGVARHVASGKWQAYGGTRGVRHYLGLYGSIEDAAAAADTWRTEHHGDFARG